MFQKIFNQKYPIIGMIHFLPLVGYGTFSKEQILKRALQDLHALEEGGVDGIMVENNYDIPHKIFVEPETVALMTYLTSKIRQKISLPLGVSVLWNDYKAALSIAKICDASFVRVPVFVDSVRTNYGEVVGDAQAVTSYRKQIGADAIALLTDIHVKHATLLSKDAITASAQKAKKSGADGLILTGKWTGDAPNMDELRRVRDVVGDFPILIGSGADSQNITSLLEYATGAIVSTSLKSGNAQQSEINVKSFEQYVDVKKVKQFMKQVTGKRLIKG